MIYEFALDPSLVASWHDPAEYRFFRGRFGAGTCRAVCCLPGDKSVWFRLVIQSVDRILSERAFRDDNEREAARQNAHSNLEILARHLTQEHTTRACRALDNDVSEADAAWLTRAQLEHARRAFHAILTSASCTDAPLCPPLVDATTLENDDPVWEPPRPRMRRDLVAFADLLAPVLRHAREVRLVDPFYDPDREDYALLLPRLIETANRVRGDCNEPFELQLHTCIDRKTHGDRRTHGDERRAANQLVRRTLDNVRPSLDARAHMMFSVFVWSERWPPHIRRGRGPRQGFHNRYLLTHTGGIQFGNSFDLTRGFDDPTLLSREQWVELNLIYRSNATAFRRVADGRHPN